MHELTAHHSALRRLTLLWRDGCVHHCPEDGFAPVRRSGTLWRLAGLFMLSLVACDGSPTAPPAAQPGEIASLRISGDTVLAAGHQATLGAVARTADGTILPGVAITWASLDTDVAAVLADGTVHALQPGLARVMASSDSAADTLTVRVRAADLALGEMAGRVRSASGSVAVRWSGVLTARETLGAPERNVSGLLANRQQVGTRDSAVTLILPRLAETGAWAITAYPLGGGTPTGAVVQFAVGQQGVDRQVYYALGGSIVIRSAAYPPRPGHTPGTAEGTLSFRATRYTVGGGGAPVPTADTVEVYLDFHVRLQHRLSSSATLVLDGAGPLRGASLSASGQSSTDDVGGILVWWDADFDGAPHGYPYEASQEFRLLSPAVGTYQLADITPPEWEDKALWPAAFASIGFRDDPRMGFSDSGTLTITEYIPPSAEYYGVIRGSIVAVQELWRDPTQSSGERVTATGTFAILIVPLSGDPN